MKLTKQRVGEGIALILLLAFFAPYVYKIPQLDITLILLGGVALAIFDFMTEDEPSK